MKSFVAAIVAMATAAAAFPTLGGSALCPNTLYSVPQCCDPNVLNVAALDCHNPKSVASPDAIKADCASTGSQPLCCSIPLAQQALLCNPVVGA